MCGIAGLLSDAAGQGPVARMVEAMKARGPDDRGLLALPAGFRRLVFGSTRLAIQDLSSAGHMPMSDPSGACIVYNGEVYNFTELRRELAAAGEEFQSLTDTEVVLAAHRRWGTACMNRFRGMFAFAIWNPEAQEIFLARDRLGKKPLYYWIGPQGTFLFASEVRALLASGLPERRLDGEALAVYLHNGFMVAPLTAVRGVRSLLPGEWMRVGLDGAIRERRRYWALSSAPARGEDVEEQEQALAAEIEAAVRIRLLADVPVGAFLSGGLDSSIIVALMAQSGGDVRTFSLTFDEREYDEGPFAREVATRFGTRHTEVKLTRRDFEARLPEALAALDQPSFDGTNTYFVARAARESGLTVALSGAGADELFGGYPFFRTVPLLRHVVSALALLPGVLRDGLCGALEKPLAALGTGPAGSLKLLELLPTQGGGPPVITAYQAVQLLFPWWWRSALLLEPSPAAPLGLPRPALAAIAEEARGYDATDQVSQAALRLFLGERCLRDIDAASMASSLEVRAPFTDQRVVEQAFRIPARRRCAGSPDKPFQDRLARRWLGPDRRRRGKQGFIFPFERWLREGGALESMRLTLTDDRLAESAGFRPAALRHLWQIFVSRRSSIRWSRIWSLFVLLEWIRRHRVNL